MSLTPTTPILTTTRSVTVIDLPPDLACDQCAGQKDSCRMRFLVPLADQREPIRSLAQGCLACDPKECEWRMTKTHGARLLEHLNAHKKGSKSKAGDEPENSSAATQRVTTAVNQDRPGSPSVIIDSDLTATVAVDRDDKTSTNGPDEQIMSSVEPALASPATESKAGLQKGPWGIPGFFDDDAKPDIQSERMKMASTLRDGDVLSAEQLEGLFGFFKIGDGSIGQSDILCDLCNLDKRGCCHFTAAYCIPDSPGEKTENKLRYCPIGPAYGSRYGSIYETKCAKWASTDRALLDGKNGPQLGQIRYSHVEDGLKRRRKPSADDKAILEQHKREDQTGPCGVYVPAKRRRIGRTSTKAITPVRLFRTVIAPRGAPPTPASDRGETEETPDPERGSPTVGIAYGSGSGSEPDVTPEKALEADMKRAQARYAKAKELEIATRVRTQQDTYLQASSAKLAEATEALDESRKTCRKQQDIIAARLRQIDEIRRIHQDEIAVKDAKAWEERKRHNDAIAAKDTEIDELRRSQQPLRARLALVEKDVEARDGMLGMRRQEIKRLEGLLEEERQARLKCEGLLDKFEGDLRSWKRPRFSDAEDRT